MKMLLSVKLSEVSRWLAMLCGMLFCTSTWLSPFFRKQEQQAAVFRKGRSLLGQLVEVAVALPVACGPREALSVP